MNIVIPLGGRGERFVRGGYLQPKPLIDVCGQELVVHVVNYVVGRMTEDDVLYVVYHSELSKYGIEDVLLRRFPTSKLVELTGTEPTIGAAETVHIGLESVPTMDRHRPCLLMDGDTFYRNVDILALARQQGKRSNAVFAFQDEHDVDGRLFSYIDVDPTDAKIRRIQEKQRISSLANSGAYYFADTHQLYHYSSRAFFDPSASNEFYTSCVIGAMLSAGEPFTAIAIQRSDVIFLGTPAQWTEFTLEASTPPVEYVLDLDGTIVLTDDLYAQVWSTMIGCNRTFFDEHIRGYSDDSVVARLGLERSVEQVSCEKERLFSELLDRGARVGLVPGVIDFITRLARPVTIVTNSNRPIAEKLIRTIGLDPFVKLLIVGGECAHSKPHPEPYLTAFRMLHTPPEYVILFEDSTVGMRSAVAARPKYAIGVVSLEDKERQRGKLIAAGAVCTVDDYTHVTNAILSLDLCRQVHCQSVVLGEERLKGGFIAEVRRVTIVYSTGERVSAVFKQKATSRQPSSMSHMATFLQLHERETTFYTFMCRNVGACMNVPKCLAIVESGMVLEDLSKPGWRISVDLENDTSSQLACSRVLSALANLHRLRIDSVEYSKVTRVGDVSWVPFVRNAWPVFKEKFAGTSSPRHIALAEDIVRRFQDIESHLARPPHCLCHGDVKSDNLFFDTSMMPYFIDWQYVSLGKGAQDVVFFMIESFSPGFMREHIDELKDQYFQALTSTTKRSRSEFEEDFVHAAQYFPFFVAMWFGTTPEHDLVDTTFPQRFVQKLFGFYDTIGL